MASFRFRSKSQGGGSSASSAGCLGIFGLVFAAAGIFFTYLLVRDFLETVDARGWDQVPAVLTESDIEVSKGKDAPFALRTTFTYEFGGREYSSGRHSLKEGWSDDYEKLALKLKALRAQPDLTAYVNPDEPTVAVIDPGSLAFGFTILFPLIFVAVGIGCVFGAIQIARKAKKKKGEPAESVEAISSHPTKKSGGAVVGVIFGAIFTAVGFGALYALAIKPFALANSAKNWVETPCEIIWAKVQSHDSDDGTTYSVDIFYAYEFDGQKHRSNRYSFMGGSSSGHKGKKEVVDSYIQPEAPVCYVDPDLPERAVLKRELGGSAFLALIPIIFILMGGAVLIFSLRSWKNGRDGSDKSGARSVTGFPGDPSPATVTLSPGKSRLTSVVGLLFVGLFWNGIVFGFLFPEAWLDGGGGIFLKLFSIPFIAVGVGIALGFVYAVLTLFNPKPILILEPGEPELGVPAFLKWRFKGSTGRLRRMRIIIRGVETATYTRGTDTVTDKQCFYASLISEQTHTLSMQAGTAEFTLHSDLMYSFDFGNNSILWKIEVKGEIAFWPDVADTFDIYVRPHPKP